MIDFSDGAARKRHVYGCPDRVHEASRAEETEAQNFNHQGRCLREQEAGGR